MTFQKIALRPLAAAAAATAVVGSVASANVPQPQYTIVSADEAFEIRRYAPSVLAKTTVLAEYAEASNRGFRVLAGYIFGGNASDQKIEMTAPVGASPFSADNTEGWEISFVMPEEHTLASLPKPDDGAVELTEIPARTVAALTFTGWAGQRTVKRKMEQMLKTLEVAGLQPANTPVVARYNPPWAPPFLRRNEILVELENASLPTIPDVEAQPRTGLAWDAMQSVATGSE